MSSAGQISARSSPAGGAGGPAGEHRSGEGRGRRTQYSKGFLDETQQFGKALRLPNSFAYPIVGQDRERRRRASSATSAVDSATCGSPTASRLVGSKAVSDSAQPFRWPRRPVLMRRSVLEDPPAARLGPRLHQALRDPRSPAAGSHRKRRPNRRRPPRPRLPPLDALQRLERLRGKRATPRRRTGYTT